MTFLRGFSIPAFIQKWRIIFYLIACVFYFSAEAAADGKNECPGDFVCLKPESADTVFVSDTVCSASLPYLWNGQSLFSSGTYFFTMAGAAGDSTTRLSLLVLPSSPPKPPSPTVASRVLCRTEIAQFSCAATGTSYQWELIPANAGIINQVPGSPNASVQWNASAFGKVRVLVRVQTACGISPPSDTLFVWVLPYTGGKLPAPQTEQTELCHGIVSSLVYAEFPASQYLWAIAPPSAGGLSGTGDSIHINWNPNFTGTAFLFYNSVTPCGFKKSDSLAIAVRPRLPSQILNLDSLYCQRASAFVLPEGVPAAGQFFLDNLPITTFSLAQAGLFSVRYQPPGCYLAEVKLVKVQEHRQAFITDFDTLFCATAELQPLAGQPPNGIFEVDGQVRTQFSAAVPGLYLLSYRAFCTDTASLHVRVIPSPSPQISISGPGFCVDDLPANLSLQPEGGQLLVDGIQVPAFIPSQAGLHYLIYKLKASNCEASDTLPVQVDSRPAPVISLDNPALQTFCRRDTFLQVYGWPAGGIFSSPAIQNGVFNPALLSSGDHLLSYLVYNGVCLDSATLPVKILSVPEVEAGVPADSLCEGGPAFFLASGLPEGGYWSGPMVSGNYFHPDKPGNFSLAYTLPALEGQRCAATDFLNLTVKDGPPLRQVSDTSLCEGQQISWSLQAGAWRLRWEDGSGDFLRQIGKPGSYFFRAEDGNCSWSSDTMQVHRIRPLPVFSLGGDRQDCFRTPVRLKGPAGMAGYQWVFSGEPFSTDSVCTFSGPGECRLSVTDSLGCSYSAQLNLTLLECPEVYIPEAFSPNGDGVNEFWKIFGENLSSVSVAVFNAWGEQVFSGQGKEAIWDGKFRGIPCPPGAYQFVVNFAGHSKAGVSFSDRVAGQVFIVK